MTDRHLEAHDFPLCIGVIDGTYKMVVEPSEYLSDFIKTKVVFVKFPGRV